MIFFLTGILNIGIKHQNVKSKNKIDTNLIEFRADHHLLGDRVSRDSKLAERNEGTEVINSGHYRVGSLFYFLHCTIVHLLRACLTITFCAVLV